MDTIDSAANILYAFLIFSMHAAGTAHLTLSYLITTVKTDEE
jgi:hypothetical protein